MSPKKGIHFEVSERKVLLRLMDLVVIFLGLYLLQLSIDFDYVIVNSENVMQLTVLGAYIIIFGTIFELYDLLQASRIDITFKNIILTASTTVITYLLTPVITPFLPENRLQIFYLFLTIVGMIFLWRLAYITFIQSPRFYKKVLAIGDVSNLDMIIEALKIADPNYKIIGFINSEAVGEEPIKFRGLKEFEADNLIDIIKEERISEILVASLNAETIAPRVYHNLITLLERGFAIREYT